MNTLLKVAEGLRRLLEVIDLGGGWLLVIMACLTSFDVVAHKFGMELLHLLPEHQSLAAEAGRVPRVA